uniref:Reverse transcriptase domain-containing protein n=1 Tax=Tanacetum cinerariifolium TaxID=118510 RepID=A0A6L2NMC0_TANCI|nr:hypothetical protein [Tanacetum cinerariifolium]
MQIKHDDLYWFDHEASLRLLYYPGLQRFFRCAMFIYLFYLCHSLSLYSFTERYAQPYFFSCLIRQRGVTIPIEDQPLPVDASPTTLSLGYVADSYPLKEDLEVDPEKDLADYLANEGDDDEEESSDDDAEDDEDEEEHLVLTDSTLPAIDPVPSTEEIEPFEIDESTATSPPPRSPRIVVPLSSTGLRRAWKITGLDFTHGTDYGFIDTLDASIEDAEERASTTLKEVDERTMYARGAWSRSEDRSTTLEALIRAQEARIIALEAQVRTLQTQHDKMECRGKRQKMDPKKTTTPMFDAAIKALTVGHDDAYGMSWKTTMKMMIAKYYPRKLALMYKRMFLEESDEAEKYVGKLPDMIQGSVMESKPKTMQDAIEFTNDLMDQKIRTFAKRQAKNKRKLDDNSKNNHTQQQPHKRYMLASLDETERGYRRTWT